MAAPTVEQAVQARIVDRTYKDRRHGIVQSFSGSVIFKHGLRRWSAIGHAAVIIDGEVVQNGYIEFEQLAPETISQKQKKTGGLFSSLRGIF